MTTLHKFTLYLTDEQWLRMSKWSCEQTCKTWQCLLQEPADPEEVQRIEKAFLDADIAIAKRDGHALRPPYDPDPIWPASTAPKQQQQTLPA